MVADHPSSGRAALPVTGAWLPGMPAGHRRFLTIADDHPLALDGGTTLSDVTIAYETWGALDDSASNAVLLCHAWTGDSHAVGLGLHEQAGGGWWEGMIGPGLFTGVFAWSIHHDASLHMPGLAVLIAAACMAVAFAITLTLPKAEVPHKT